LTDNALDACETARVPPEVGVAVEQDEDGVLRLSVSDNGPGIPAEVVRKVLDYTIRVSDKAAYRSPTRGAQGNALKTIIGIPYALGSREPTIVVARGVQHTISPWVDPAGEVRISHAEVPVDDSSLAEPGTCVSLAIPEEEQDFDPLHWVRSFAAFNPHATFSYLGKTASSEVAEMGSSLDRVG
jgi:DNA topoisomerase VI subunit B